jgi:hypothetical protein
VSRGRRLVHFCAFVLLRQSHLYYIFVKLKFPEPVHPDPAPVKVHVPEIVLLFTLPCSASTFWFPGNMVEMVIPNAPVTFPLKFPLSVNEPVSVVGELKQGADVEKVSLITLTVELPLF